MRGLTKGAKYCNQCSACAREDRPNQGEASERFFEDEGSESSVENEARLVLRRSVGDLELSQKRIEHTACKVERTGSGSVVIWIVLPQTLDRMKMPIPN